MKRLFLIFFLLVSTLSFAQQKGLFFNKKEYVPTTLLTFSKAKDSLPQPVYDENPLWVETYWKAWEIIFKNFYEPNKANGFVSQYIDAAFNNNIFMWDASFMTMFCNYAYPIVPGIATLDNFYIKQYPNGEICREISRGNGSDCEFWVNKKGEEFYSSWGYDVAKKREKTFIKYIDRELPSLPSFLTLDNMNHPIMAWAEIESFKMTGDKTRLKMVYEPLKHQYTAFQKYSRQGNGLYMTDWASMDNSERNKYLEGGGMGIDISCEMVLFARNLSQIAQLIGCSKDAKTFKNEANELAIIINKLMWSAKDKFYYDITVSGTQVGIKTVAAYWSLLSKVADPEQAASLATHLTNPLTFGRKNLVPTLSADEKEFSEFGDYWCGSVWAPTNTMVINGLENYGYNELSRKVALNHVALVANVFKKTGTIWENYSPDKKSQGFHKDGSAVMNDFVGWSGIGPIKLFIEYAIGLKADAESNSIEWTITSDKAVGCKNFRFNCNVITLLADFSNKSNEIYIKALKPFVLKINFHGVETKFKIKRGIQLVKLE